jgi:5-methyltetrahydropteroyltriglutamate--homocysteine methyltransferase
VKLLLTTYFEGVTPNLDTITALPVQGLHVDLVHGKDDVAELHKRLPADWLLSAGLVNGRNVWRADLTENMRKLKISSANVSCGWPLPAPCCTARSI